MRQDGFILGQDPEAKGYEMGADSAAPGTSDETIIDFDGGCSKCLKGWPQVKFTKMAGKVFYGAAIDPKEILCDSCWPSELETEIAEKIDEATGAQPAASVLVRSAMVTGIESRTNIIGFQFPTHVRGEELTLTDIQVTFKGKQSAEIAPCPVYVYKDVPLIIAQVWCEAPSHGESFGRYFIEQIKNSYAFERKV